MFIYSVVAVLIITAIGMVIRRHWVKYMLGAILLVSATTGIFQQEILGRNGVVTLEGWASVVIGIMSLSGGLLLLILGRKSAKRYGMPTYPTMSPTTPGEGMNRNSAFDFLINITTTRGYNHGQ